MNPTKDGVAAVAEDGANVSYDAYNMAEFCLANMRSMMNNHASLPSWPIVKRSYEKPIQLYYLVFKPFNKNYKRSFDAMDHVRKKIGTGHQAVIICREINSTKVHYHAMVFTEKDLMYLHDSITNKFKIHCQNPPMIDKYKVHEYLIKEAHVRYFYKHKKPWSNQDIYVYPSPNFKSNGDVYKNELR